jgi:hypothetical protein
MGLDLLFEHDLFPNTCLHPGSSPGQAFLGIILGKQFSVRLKSGIGVPTTTR